MSGWVLAGLIFAGVAVGYEIRRRQERAFLRAAKVRARRQGRREMAVQMQRTHLGLDAVAREMSQLNRRRAAEATAAYATDGDRIQ